MCVPVGPETIACFFWLVIMSNEEWILNKRDPNAPEQGGESFVVTHKASEEFINRIQVERQSGYGFLPIIGAGFSAPSGAPLVNELGSYLQRCIWLALGDENPDGHRWHPRTDQWPPFLNHEPHNHEQKNYLNLLLKRRMDLESGNKDVLEEEKREIPILLQGIGAMAEWRTSLLFLSRLKHQPRSEHYSAASLGAARQEIVDACLREVLKGKHPSLNHTMLGVLAGALRLNLILTTNFDDLLERAFAEAKNPLQVFEVHLGDYLPHWSAVSDVRSLVKFHGNRHALRADYSLDADPSEHDKERFLEYLQAGRGEHPKQSQELPFQNHLLVMGVSGEDRRTRELIKHAGKHLGSKFKVFWLCYSDKDISDESSGLKAFAREYQRSTEREEGDGLVVLKHTNYGLLLLQLYQTIRRNLPPTGGLFPSVSRLTLPPLRQVPEDGSPARRATGPSFSRELVNRLELLNKSAEQNVTRLVVAAPATEVRGMTSACMEAFYQLEPDHVCLWLDMNDISSADNLFEVLLEAAYFRLGQENWVPTYRETSPDRRIKEMAHVMRSASKPWVVFLNLRETPGANTEDEERDITDNPHGWADRSPDVSDPSSGAVPFVRLIKQLCEEQSAKISVVLMCRSETGGLMETLRVEKLLESPLRLQAGMREVYPFSESDVVSKAIEWTQDREDRKSFLNALVLMQRPRFLSTIWSTAVTREDSLEEPAVQSQRPEGDKVDERQRWLTELEKCGLVRRKPGGFIWLHSRCREKMRRILWRNDGWQDNLSETAQQMVREWNAKLLEPEIHSKLANWYEKVLDASKAPAAVFEAAYHLCKGAKRYIERYQILGDEADLRDAGYRLDAASGLLQANSFLIQTQGYARGSCRRLHHIRNKLCMDLFERKNQDQTNNGPGRKPEDDECFKQATQRLRRTCTELMRAIAREVGEDKKAYIRHQQFVELYAQKGVAPLSEDEGKRQIGNREFGETLLQAMLSGPGQPEDVRPDWIRWLRWSGMLATSTRSYHSACRAFRKALQYAVGPLDDPRTALERCPLVGCDEPQIYNSRSQELKVEALRVLEQYVELQLLRHSLARRLSLHNVKPSNLADLETAEAIEASLRRNEELIRRGRKLASKIREQDHSSDSRHAIAANWCECRLLIHQSVCTARWRQLGKETIENPLGLLGDAESILRISDHRRYRSDLAMVELHRAQARLWAAETVPVAVPAFAKPKTLSESKEQFWLLCQGLDQHLRNEPYCQPDEVRKTFLLDGNEANLRRARSLVVDGINFLNRVEPILRARRRNVWWTTWFFERYLSAIALSVWTSVFEQHTPIPFFGLEAAPSGTPSLADDLLGNSLRMISVDTYRMATIVDAYASCARALQIRLTLDIESPRLHSRQGTLRANLREALDKLDRVRELRNDSASAKTSEDTAMHPDVELYVTEVQKRAGLIYEKLPE